jgi:tetratricopeptide (TPR) repeat protein
LSTLKTIIRAHTASVRNEIKICLCIFCLAISNFHFCCAMPASVHHKAPTVGGKNEKQETKPLPKTPPSTDWWRVSALADKLIDERKYGEAESMLNSILPRARKEAPESLDYALTLCRLSTDLYALKKYPQALAKAQEAMEILNRHADNISRRRVIWRCMGTKVAILLALQKNAEAEAFARKTVAYAIAFPDIATAQQTKVAYILLNNSLVAQKKFEEAKKISEIMNQQ